MIRSFKNLKLYLLMVVLISGICAFCQHDLTIQQIDSIFKDCVVIEGDILVHKDFVGTDACYATNFWTNGIIPFEFNPNVTQQNQNNAIQAMAEWEDIANVDFVPRNGQSNYIHIYSATSNYSYVGMQGGMQLVGIVSWGSRFVIVHELCHALGFWHEQSRANRDDYVQINWDCIPDDLENNFEKHSGAGHYGYYDFMSVMHYSATAFYEPNQPDCNEPYSITVLPPYQAYQNLIGQRDSLTYLDRTTMSFVYPEVNWLFVDLTNSGTQSGTFLEPFQTFLMGALVIPPGGTLWIQPGPYIGVGIYSKAMTLKAPLGLVLLY